MVSLVIVRSMLYLNIIGKVITKDFGYTPRVGNNTTAVNEDDALYVFTRTSYQKGLHFSPKFARMFSTQASVTAEHFQSVTL